MTEIRLACVPEQVNIPVSYLQELGIAEKYNINVKVIWVPEGTGRMLEMLEKNEADIAMTVTDAFIVANSQGREVQLAGVWVTSPLVWAIAASPNLPDHVTTLSELIAYRRSQPGQEHAKLRVGISRPGSGSQTMAAYMMHSHCDYSPVAGTVTGDGSDGSDSNTDSDSDIHSESGTRQEKMDIDFHTAHTFANLRAGVQRDEFDVFLWETFTTKPFFDAKELRKLGDVQTPWPAFSFVTSRHLQPGLGTVIRERLFPALHKAAQHFVGNTVTSAERIVQEHGHQAEDALTWLQTVQYNGHPDMQMEDGPDVFLQSVKILQAIDLVKTGFVTESLWEESPRSSLGTLSESS